MSDFAACSGLLICSGFVISSVSTAAGSNRCGRSSADVACNWRLVQTAKASVRGSSAPGAHHAQRVLLNTWQPMVTSLQPTSQCIIMPIRSWTPGVSVNASWSSTGVVACDADGACTPKKHVLLSETISFSPKARSFEHVSRPGNLMAYRTASLEPCTIWREH